MRISDWSSDVCSSDLLSLTRIYSGPEGFLQLIEQFEDGVQAFSLNDFRESYTPMQWRELVPRRREAGFSQARVRGEVEPTDQLPQDLTAGKKQASLPTRLDADWADQVAPNNDPHTPQKNSCIGKVWHSTAGYGGRPTEKKK